MKSETHLDLVGIGSMVVDRMHRTPRIIGPDEKGPLSLFPGSGPVQRFVGGVVLNQLGWAAALGLRTGIFGKQADDDNGRFLREAMDRLGIDRHLVLDGSGSSLSEIFIDEAGERAIYMSSAATGETSAEHVRRHHADFIRRGLRVSTEISQLPLDATLEVLSIAREAGIPTVIDVDVPPSYAVPLLGSEATLRSCLRAADLLKPSKAAAVELVPEADGDALSLARGIRSKLGTRVVVVTDGERGCAIAADEFEGWIPALPVKVVDTTGAGDAFVAGLLVALHHGLGLESAGRLANACGAACVERLGAFPEEPLWARERVLELYGKPLPLAPLRAESGGVGDATAIGRSGAAGARSAEPHEALATIDVVIEELQSLRKRTGPSRFEESVRLIRASEAGGGRVHVTGVGKASHAARYGAALLSSTGTPASFLDPVESVHGASGQVIRGDVVIAVSNSGETEELTSTIALVRALGAHVVAVTGALDSWLARHADIVIDASVEREGGGLGLAPRASVAAQTLLLGALAATLERESGFERAEYLARHPGGSLGKKLRGE
ncbi:Arabinose 5-phosphate isomerase KdsD [Myxococcaceae bacterium]|jgi:arabinose-5-phosphate isomerase|nr:Arabinose 5-phosphate isomerase KdsD [Myxococcaceae bacterium]